MSRHCVRIAVDGELYSSLKAVTHMARTRGFTGCDGTIRARLKAGATTWAELLVAPNAERAASGRKRAAVTNARLAKEKELMAQLCAELDARKAALKEAA